MEGTLAIMPETITADEDLEYAYVKATDLDTMKAVKLVYRLELIEVQDEEGNILDYDLE